MISGNRSQFKDTTKKMIDNVKFICEQQTIIRRLRSFPDAKPYANRLNVYEGFEVFGKLLRLDFRKSFEGGEFVGYRHLELSISPHYHFNDYKHNGNDLTPENAQKTVKEILTYLGIKETEFKYLIVVNIEFGLNILPATPIEKIITGLSFHKKTPFIIPDPANPFNKITDATKYKKIKAYAKGLQFSGFPDFNIDLNTFRFEVKSKKSSAIRSYGIVTASDLFKDQVFQRLATAITQEWEQVLFIDTKPYLERLPASAKKYIIEHSNPLKWSAIVHDKNRNKFIREKQKYYSILQKTHSIREEIKDLINLKFFSFGLGANCPQDNKTGNTHLNLINKGKGNTEPFKKVVQIVPHARVVNGKSAPSINLHRCLVTGLDISMQKKESKFLFQVGLRHYKKFNPQIYDEVLNKFWSPNCKGKDTETLHKTIAHNIRNLYNNSRYARMRNINPDQMAFEFSESIKGEKTRQFMSF